MNGIFHQRRQTAILFNGMDVLEKKEFLSSKRSLLYVAITRARQLVYMVGYGEPCGLLENINKTI